MSDINQNTPSITEIKKSLRDANLYDAAMTHAEMFEIYRAVEDSKTMAQAELDKSLSMVHEDDSPPDTNETADDDSFELSNSRILDKMQLGEENEFERNNDIIEQNTENLTSNVELFESQDGVDPFNSLPMPHSPLKQLFFKPLYAPFYCNLKGSPESKAKVIMETHQKMLKKFDEYQCKSLFPAPWGKPIETSSHFNGSLLRKVEKYSDETFEESQDDNQSSSKPGNDDLEVCVLKSGRQTKRKLYTDDVEDSEVGDWKKKSKPLSEKCKTKYPAKKHSDLKNMSNQEIMKRSKLFSDASETNCTNTRVEKMFDNLVKDIKQKQDNEKRIEKFQNSLDIVHSENDDGDIDIIECSTVEERRVIPPPSRNFQIDKGKRNAKQQAQVNPLREVNRSEEKYKSLETSNIKGSKQQSTVSYNIRTCEICDLVVGFDEDFETHVRECIKNK